jgi:lipid II:glycine glycyltransferase (peptidoglycan interpeptide bridge formation enzyme)
MQIEQELETLGWQTSTGQIQFRNTMILDLNDSEEAILAGMKQKTRYNIRLASRRGVTVRKGGSEDLELLYQMYAETAVRDRFTIRDPAYYKDAWGTFFDNQMAQPFIADVNGNPIAGIIVFRFGSVATYMYGMSSSLHREKMPNHLLQWEAIKWAMSKGCNTYDFWGAPDDLVKEDRMWGVYRFKSGFGAKFLRLIGAWDFPARPTLYLLYAFLLPKILGGMRFLGRRQTRASLDE